MLAFGTFRELVEGVGAAQIFLQRYIRREKISPVALRNVDFG
jgi:hypothetical protein